jgi:hypothetical protein
MSLILQTTLPFAPWMDPRTNRLPGVLPLKGDDWLRVDEAFGAQMAERDRLIREVPGLSLNYGLDGKGGNLPNQKTILSDGDALSTITRFKDDLDELEHLDFTTMALPYHLYVISTQVPGMPPEVQYGTALVLLLITLTLTLLATGVRTSVRRRRDW